MKILILSPHIDDAEFGAGATIRKFTDNTFCWIAFSDCAESLPEGFPEETLRKEFKQICKLYGIDNYTVANFPVRNFTSHRQEILEILFKARNEFNPDLVIGPSLNDTHQDHTVIANEMIRAFKNTSIISYELPWNNLKSVNNYYVRITSEQLEFKLKVLSLYESQIVKNRPYSNPEFIESLAKVRGTQINVQYAEAFELIRWIN
ncbi:MAG: PIG-L family deacetylase [Pedobacter sp.]|jgi:LmbE family N-acetylglucosaminyl deacetylase